MWTTVYEENNSVQDDKGCEPKKPRGTQRKHVEVDSANSLLHRLKKKNKAKQNNATHSKHYQPLRERSSGNNHLCERLEFMLGKAFSREAHKQKHAISMPLAILGFAHPHKRLSWSLNPSKLPWCALSTPKRGFRRSAVQRMEYQRKARSGMTDQHVSTN